VRSRSVVYTEHTYKNLIYCRDWSRHW